MTKTSRLRTYTILAASIVGWMSLPAISQAADAVDSPYQIVVTADHAVEVAKIDSQKVQVVTKEEIEKKQAKTVEDIIFNETGVSRTVDAMGRIGVSIRGAEPRHTLILVDGQPALGEFAKYMGAADEVSRIGTENVEHIEVIQGAASSKYGADAIGGVVNVITKKASKKPELRFNLEGRNTFRDIKGMQDVPYSNFYLRADSGDIGNARFAIYGSKRDLMPVVAAEKRKKVSVLFAKDLDEFPENSLRYYGTASSAGIVGTYDINKDNSINVRMERYNEELHRFVKHTNSDMEPMVQFKRNATRDNYNVGYTGRKGDTDWSAEANFTRIKENDISLTTDYATNAYEGKNTLNSVDDIDHSQVSFKANVNRQINDQHYVGFAFGFSKEDGKGSRLKSAPKTYMASIDPWDYDKSLFVENKKSSDAAKVGDSEKKVSSRVHAYKFVYDKNGVPKWDFEYEATGYDPNDPNTKKAPVSFEEYINNQDSFNSWSSGGLTEDQKRRKEEFNKLILAENKERLDKEGKNYYEDIMMREYFAKNENYNLTFNGKTFLQTYKERDNKAIFGEASIKKFFATLSDVWYVNDDTTISSILRYDHSSLFGGNLSASAGITHNYKGDPHTRIKANIGTGYAEPGMGELYYNWEMFGGNPTGFGFARLGWYWIGNPNLKPEKSLNMDVAIEKEFNNKTSVRASLFHNNIKDYLTAYFTGNIIDFSPWLDESSAQGFWKFLYAPDMIYSFKNIGKATITGGDIEIKHRLNKHWDVRLGYTYLNALNKSDPSMPEKLLDKPTHKVDFGLNYSDEKRGITGSIWTNYYIDMLDSNALASKGSYMETDGWGAPHPTITYYFKEHEKHEYQKKTYGIWNMIIQKKFNKDNMAYFAIDNLFNHRDDDRALQERVYRFGVNFKVTDAFDMKAAIDPVTGEAKKAIMAPFIVAPFDTSLEKGSHWTGDIMVRNNYNLGQNKPAAHVSPDSYVSPNASKNLRDPEEQSVMTRVRVGLESRIGDNTHVQIQGEASSINGLNTSAPNEDKGPKNISLEKANVTQHAKAWDFSIGRIGEDFGATKYYFDKSFDGARAVYTKGKAQATIGFGSFKRSTGIEDSPYTHASVDEFDRPPYLEEFLGIDRDNFGFFNGGLLSVPNANDNVAFASQLVKIIEEYKKNHEIVVTPGFGLKPLLPEDYPVDKMVALLRHMQAETLKAYAGNPRLFNSGPKESSYGTNAITGRQMKIFEDRLDVVVKTKTGERHYGSYNMMELLPPEEKEKAIKSWDVSLSSWNDDDVAFKKTLKMTGYDLGDTSIFADTKREDLLKTWWKKNGKQYMNDMERLLRYSLKDDTITIVTPEDEIRRQLAEGLFLTPDNSVFMGVTGSDSYNLPNFVTAYFYQLAKALDYVDNEALIPREALASTGYGVPMKGIVLRQDEIPALEKAMYLKGKYQVNDKLGVTAWYLHSTGDKTLTLNHAHLSDKGEMNNDTYKFNQYANVFGFGAVMRLNNYSKLSLDMGINTSAFGKHMNGNTIYEHKDGTNVFKLKGYKEGSAPKFWTVRLDIGATDVDVPGSWSAFLDYKHFEHGSFFGGNGTASLPDRYLDGVQSFTLGAGYVPARNWLLEGFFTFGAKGINKRDTLFGSENFSLGNYTRVQVSYKF